MKKTKILILLLVILCFFFTGCSMSYTVEEYNHCTFGISKDDCFMGSFGVDYDKSGVIEITVPDTYKDLPVLALGGYFGRGVPTPFCIEIIKDVEQHAFVSNYVSEKDEFDEVVVKINIGKNIKEFDCLSLEEYYGIYEGENDEVMNVLYHFTYQFNIDSDNATFYSKDGIAYYKSNDQEVKY